MSDSVSASVVDLATLSAEDFETLAGQIIRVHAADGAGVRSNGAGRRPLIAGVLN